MRHFQAPLVSFSMLWFASSLSALEIPVKSDTYISSTHPKANYGKKADLVVERSVALLRFDVDALVPANASGADVSKAYVRLWVNRITGSLTLRASAIEAAWQESTATWMNRPPWAPALAQTLSSTRDDDDSFIYLDVTSIVQEWLDGTRPNHGIAIEREAADYRILGSFDSKENAATGRYPILHITLNHLLPGNGLENARMLFGRVSTTGATTGKGWNAEIVSSADGPLIKITFTDPAFEYPVAAVCPEKIESTLNTLFLPTIYKREPYVIYFYRALGEYHSHFSFIAFASDSE